MRIVPQAMTDAWLSEVRLDDDTRPVVRATIQRVTLHLTEYDCAQAAGADFGHQKGRRGDFASLLFGQNIPPIELRNILRYSWSRSVSQDVAECTIVMLNSELTPLGAQEDATQTGDFDLPGYYTPSRGEPLATEPNRWGYTDTGWENVIVPDRLVKTYEGYGIDRTVPPAQDGHLMQSGTWLIDKARYTADGDIEVRMRDVGRLLIDAIAFPPVIPYSEYPVSWETIRSATRTGRAPAGGSWKLPTGVATSSNDLYVGKNVSNPPYDAYVGADGSVNGHRAQDALVEEPNSFWQAAGQPTKNAKVWWQVDFDDETTPVSAIRLHPRQGQYKVFVSVKGPDGWIGRKKISYDKADSTGGLNLEAGIRFVKSFYVSGGQEIDLVLPRVYKRASAVRLTITRLVESHVGEYPFMAQLRDVRIYTGTAVDMGFKKGDVKAIEGNYSDFTDIVKWACAWAGFYWPTPASGDDFMLEDYPGQPSPSRTYTYGAADTKLPKGRVWGEFMSAGTAGVPSEGGDLTVDLFDKKPLMDMVAYVRDMLGFLFFIDECGGVVWRMPNRWELGNWLSPGQHENRRRTRTTEILTLVDEQQEIGGVPDPTEHPVLEDYSTEYDSTNLRERIFVANVTGKIGTVVRGFKPTGINLRRTAGWTDQNFATNKDTRVMADLIAAQQMFDYRRSKFSIPGYPAIQIDDQVRLFERVTNETYYHYVETISCELNMETGEFTYNLETHWLGDDPSNGWVVDAEQMDQVTKTYLATVGSKDT